MKKNYIYKHYSKIKNVFSFPTQMLNLHRPKYKNFARNVLRNDYFSVQFIDTIQPFHKHGGSYLYGINSTSWFFKHFQELLKREDFYKTIYDSEAKFSSDILKIDNLKKILPGVSKSELDDIAISQLYQSSNSIEYVPFQKHFYKTNKSWNKRNYNNSKRKNYKKRKKNSRFSK